MAQQGETIEALKKENEALQQEIKRLKALSKGDSMTDESADDASKGTVDKDPSQAALGVVVLAIDEKIREALREDGILRLPISGGVMVARVALGSPAQEAGIEVLDVIANIGGKPITDKEAFRNLLSEITVSRAVIVTIYRLAEQQGTGTKSWVRRTVRVTPQTHAEMLEKAGRCPLSLVSARLDYDVIGQPTVSTTVKNIAPQDVVAYTVEVHCWDRFDQPVNHSMLRDDNVFSGISQRTIRPGRTEGQDRFWTLHFFENTAKVKVILTKARLKDGSEWTSAEEEVSISAESRR